MRGLLVPIAALAASLALAGTGASAPTGEIGANDFRISQMGPDSNVQFGADSPDIAFNGTRNEFLVVWQGEDASNGDYQVFGQRLDATNGAPVGGELQISQLSADASPNFFGFSPRVAYDSVHDEYLVVWANDDQVVEGDQDVYGQRLSATGTELGTDFLISQSGSTTSNHGPVEPDVAYDPTHDEYLAVWSSDHTPSAGTTFESRIYGQRLAGGTAAPLGVDDFPLSDLPLNGLRTAADPAVTYNAAAGEYLVVWMGSVLAFSSEWEIIGQRVAGGTGLEVGGDFQISDVGAAGNTNYGAFSPRVAYGSGPNGYLVVWYGEGDPGGTLVDDEWEVFGQRLDATGAPVGADDFRISSMGAEGSPNFDAETPDVTYNPATNEYLVVWDGDDATDDEFEVYGQRVDAATGSTSGEFRLSDMGGDGMNGYNGFTPAAEPRGGSTEYLVTWWGNDDALGSFETEIFGQRYSAGTPTAVRATTLVARRSPRGVALRWRTAAGGDAAGFDVRRDGVRLNRQAIPALQRVGPATYRFLDRTARRGRVYVYTVEGIGLDGGRRVVARARVRG